MSGHSPRNLLDTPLLEAMAASIASDLIDGSVHVPDRRGLAVREGIRQTIDLARRTLEEMADDHAFADEEGKAAVLREAAEQISTLPHSLP